MHKTFGVLVFSRKALEEMAGALFEFGGTTG